MLKRFSILATVTSLTAAPFSLTTESTVSADMLYRDTALTISATFTDLDSNLWVGTTDGKLLVSSGAMVIPVDYAGVDTIPVRAITQTSDGTIWFGSNTLYKIDGGTCRSVIPAGFNEMDGNKTQVLNWVNDIAVESDSVLWIAGEGVGAIRYSVPSETAKPYFFPTMWGNTYYSMSIAHVEPDGSTYFCGRTGVNYGIYRPNRVKGVLEKGIAFDSLDYTVDLILSLGKRDNRWWITTTKGMYLADSLNGTPRFAASSELVDILLNDQKKTITGIEANLFTGSDMVYTKVLKRSVAQKCMVTSTGLRFTEPVSGKLTISDLKGRIVAESEMVEQVNFNYTHRSAPGVYIASLHGLTGQIQRFVFALK